MGLRQITLIASAALGVMLVPSAQRSARADTPLCEPIADRVRAGALHDDASASADWDNNLQRLGNYMQSIRGKSDGDTVARLLALHPTPELMAVAKERYPENVNGTALSSAPIDWMTDRIGVIDGTIGHMACAMPTFFDTQGGQVLEIAPPRGLISDLEVGPCYPTQTWIAKIGGVPGVVTWYASLDQTEDVITVFPLQNQAWGEPCHVKAEAELTLAISGATCREGTDCAQISRDALDTAQRLAKFNEPADSYWEPSVPDELQQMARKTQYFYEVPALKREKQGLIGDRFGSLSVNGQPALEVFYMPPPGLAYWVATSVWVRSGESLEPVADISFDPVRGRLLSIDVGEGAEAR